MGIATSWEEYVSNALTTYKVKFGVGKDMEAYITSDSGDFKRAFVSYMGFDISNMYEDGGVDLRVHEFAIYFTNRDGLFTDVETFINYVQTHRKIEATNISLSIGALNGSYVYNKKGFVTFEIRVLCHSTNQLS